jgi:hypothetical protein
MHVARLGRTASAIAVIAATLTAASAYAAPVPAISHAGVRATSAPAYTKVLIIAEENRTYGEVIGATTAPYLTRLAATYGSATNMTANYPVSCPSLAGYILMTSGSTGGICDDKGPRHHLQTATNVFAQVDAAHLSWRTYAEDMPDACTRKNGAAGLFLVRHTPVAYYTSENSRCPSQDVAMGTLGQGALQSATSAGTLPSYSFVTPDACHDMHGSASCPTRRIPNGDAWLSQWIPRLTTGADYRTGHLVIIITWDEGSDTSNHIPTLVISPTTRGVSSSTAFNHCSTLRTTEDILHLAPIGCAKTATSMIGAFHL